MKKIIRSTYYKIILASIFSFLFGCTITICLIPFEKTCKLETNDIGYNIMQKNQLPDSELVILILSAPKNLERRNTIRETWLQYYQNLFKNDLVKFKMKHFFVVGSFGLNADEIFHMSTEQSMYNDILILPMYDSYKNLTQKILQSFHWLNEHYNYGFNYKYVLKCDDDSFVRIREVIEELHYIEQKFFSVDIKQLAAVIKADSKSQFQRSNLQMNEHIINTNLGLYWGYFHGNAKIKTSGKWKETEWIACDKYVPYALGGGYILSHNLISIIAQHFTNYRQFHSEDVSVGLWLAPIANIIRIHDIRFDTEWSTRGCKNNYLVTHSISVDEMKKMHERILKGSNLCQNEETLRHHYFYDWNVPPSQCCSIIK